MLGKDNWEQAESAMQKETAELAIAKAGIRKGDLRYLFAGDLLGQLIATSFGTVDLEVPFFGLLRRLLHHGRSHGTGSDGSGTQDMRTTVTVHGIQPFCNCGKAVPLSSGLWKPEAYVSQHGQ